MGLFVRDMYSLVKDFTRNFKNCSLFQASWRATLTHTQSLPSANHLRRYSSMLGALHGEFSRQFEDFKTVESEMHTISSPFTCSVDNAPTDAQLEPIDLQSDLILAEHLKSVSLLDFYSSLKEEDSHTRGSMLSSCWLSLALPASVSKHSEG